jgi:hypothetical protein
MSIVLFLYKEDFYEKRFRPITVLASHCHAARRVWVKESMLRTIVFGDRPRFLDWAGVEIGRAQPHGILSDIDCPPQAEELGSHWP